MPSGSHFRGCLVGGKWSACMSYLFGGKAISKVTANLVVAFAIVF